MACLASSRHSSICCLKNACLSNDTGCTLIKKRPSLPRRRPRRFGIRPAPPNNALIQDDEILELNCVQARANQRRPTELFRSVAVLQVGNCPCAQRHASAFRIRCTAVALAEISLVAHHSIFGSTVCVPLCEPQSTHSLLRSRPLRKFF